MDDQPKKFLNALLDFRFEQFITLKFISVLYIIAIGLAGLAALVFAFSGFSAGFLSGLFTLILAPILFLAYVVASRIWLELIVVIFRIADNTRTLINLKQPGAVASDTTPPEPPAEDVTP